MENGQPQASQSQQQTALQELAEALDYDCVNKNGFCILVGAYLRKHAVSPKNANIKEYEILLNAYRSLFKILEKDFKGA
jgi:hypothetical protein